MAKPIAPSVQQSESKIAGLLDQMKAVIRRSGLNDDQLQAIRDSGRLSKEFGKLLATIALQISGVFTFLVDYTKTAAQLIEEAAFDYKFVYADIPNRGKGQSTAHIQAVHLNRVITNRELVKELPNLVDPITALHFAISHPDEQRKYPLVTVWQDEAGRFFYLILSESAGGRELSVRGNGSGGGWDEDCRFLVFSK